MLGVKILIYSSIFLVCSIIGLLKSQKYVYRVEELQEFKNALNMFKTKIKFTYEPIPDVFLEISKKIKGDVGKLFWDASRNMSLDFAGDAWEKSLNNSNIMLLEDDKEALRSLGKLLGSTDIDGQLSQIRLVNGFLNEQIKEAIEQKDKNETMYKKLGIIVGLAVVIVLV